MFLPQVKEGMKKQNKNIWNQIREVDFTDESLIQILVNPTSAVW